jgi:cyclohexanone monooxygenase
MQLADLQKMESIRRRVDDLVKDPKTREALKPWFNQFCKRPCFHDEYLQAFNRPNVHLVDTEGKGVDRVYEKGIVANDTKYELDCIVYATEFEWATDFSARAGAQIFGRGGLSLTEKFKDGIEAMHGWGVNGFPNMGLVSIHQSGSSPNWTHNSTEMTKHIVHVISECQKRGIVEAEPSQTAVDAWVKECVRAAQPRADFLRKCTPGYYGDEGKIDDHLVKSQPYLAGGGPFFKTLDEWRKEEKLRGVDVKYEQREANL